MITCSCGGKLDLDMEESRNNSLCMVYCCQSCYKLYVLKQVGEKPRGWKVKKKLEDKKLMSEIPF